MRTTEVISAADALFAMCPGSIALFAAFHDQMADRFPDAAADVQKTQVTYRAPKVFACASLLRARRKAELPDPYLTVTLGLPTPLDSLRVAQCSEPHPGRWTHHIVVGSEADLDQELFAWVAAAYDFALRKSAHQVRSGDSAV